MILWAACHLPVQTPLHCLVFTCSGWPLSPYFTLTALDPATISMASLPSLSFTLPSPPLSSPDLPAAHADAWPRMLGPPTPLTRCLWASLWFPPPPPPEKVRGKGGKRKYQERGTFWTSEIVAAKTKEEDHSLSSPQESLLGSWLSDSWPGTYRHRLCHRWSLPHCLESGSLGLHLGDIAFQL